MFGFVANFVSCIMSCLIMSFCLIVHADALHLRPILNLLYIKLLIRLLLKLLLRLRHRLILRLIFNHPAFKPLLIF